MEVGFWEVTGIRWDQRVGPHVGFSGFIRTGRETSTLALPHQVMPHAKHGCSKTLPDASAMHLDFPTSRTMGQINFYIL
jgi:hypothetical protein